MHLVSYPFSFSGLVLSHKCGVDGGASADAVSDHDDGS